MELNGEYVDYGDVVNHLRDKRCVTVEDGFYIYEQYCDKGLYKDCKSLEDILHATVVEYDREMAEVLEVINNDELID